MGTLYFFFQFQDSGFVSAGTYGAYFGKYLQILWWNKIIYDDHKGQISIEKGAKMTVNKYSSNCNSNHDNNSNINDNNNSYNNNNDNNNSNNNNNNNNYSNKNSDKNINDNSNYNANNNDIDINDNCILI